MNQSVISSTSNAYKLYRINEALINWNLEPVHGEGLFHNPSGIYGHLKISMYATNDGIRSSSVIYRLDEKLLPEHLGHKKYIEDTLGFFVSYLSGLKGKIIALTFEITDGSYSPIDSRGIFYSYAVIEALLKCFDRGSEISPGMRDLIIRLQNQAMNKG